MDRPMTPVPIQPRRVLDGVVGSEAAVAMVRWKWVVMVVVRVEMAANTEEELRQQ